METILLSMQIKKLHNNSHYRSNYQGNFIFQVTKILIENKNLAFEFPIYIKAVFLSAQIINKIV